MRRMRRVRTLHSNRVRTQGEGEKHKKKKKKILMLLDEPLNETQWHLLGLCP